MDNRRESLRSSSLRLSHPLRCFTARATRLELGGKQGRERESVPPRLPSGWAAGLDLDRLKGVFRGLNGITASGSNDAEVSWPDFGTPLHPDHVS